MKQSSIEWLMEIDKSRAITIEEWEQGKAMHKEEIENAYNSGQESNWSENMGLMGDWYYDKTFNNEL